MFIWTAGQQESCSCLWTSTGFSCFPALFIDLMVKNRQSTVSFWIWWFQKEHSGFLSYGLMDMSRTKQSVQYPGHMIKGQTLFPKLELSGSPGNDTNTQALSSLKALDISDQQSTKLERFSSFPGWSSIFEEIHPVNIVRWPNACSCRLSCDAYLVVPKCDRKNQHLALGP